MSPSSVPILAIGPTIGSVICDKPRKSSDGPAALAKTTLQVFSKQRDVMVDSRNRPSQSGLYVRASGEASCGVPNSDLG